MDFVVFINCEKDCLVEQIQLPSGESIFLNEPNYDFKKMEDFLSYNFSILYSNGKIENAKLVYVGEEKDGTPMFSYDLLDNRKGDLDDE
jgi:hypothetical protein